MNIYLENKKNIKPYTLVESYQKSHTTFLLNNEDVIKKYCVDDWYFRQLKYKIQQFNKGEQQIQYTQNKDEHKSKYYDRWYGKGSQQIPAEIRKFIQGENVVDIDIVNSCCVVLLGITSTYLINNKYLKKYVKNRQKVIDDFYDGDKDKCKKFINCCLFSDSSYSNNEFEKYMIDEMKQIKIDLSKHDNFEEIFEYNKQLDEKKLLEKPTKEDGTLRKPNVYGCFICDIYSIYETNIIWKAMEYYKKVTGDDILVQQHDGFQCTKNDKFKIEDLNNYINDCMRFKVDFIFKSNKSEISMEQEPEKVKIKVKKQKIDEEKTDEETTDEEVIEESINYYISIDDLETPINLSNTIKKELSKNLVYCYEKWFMKQNNLWILVKEPSSVVIETINIFIDYSINSVSNQIIKEQNTDKKEILRKSIENYRKQQKKIDSSSYYSQLLKHLKTKLLDNSFMHKLDNYPYMLCFNNGVFNMMTNKFTNNFRQCPYITKTINYDYEEAQPKDKENVIEIIKKICNCNDEHLHYYLSCLSYSITGDASKEQSIFFCIGNKGANGKTLLLNALSEHVLKGFVNKIDRKAFQEGYEKKHKHLMDFRTNRILYIEELAKKKQLDIETLKEVADGHSLSNEIMFGTKEDINIMAKLFCLGNHTPNIEDDGGTSRRIRQLEFTSEFKDGVEDDFDKRIFKKDKSMGDKLGGIYKLALLNILLEYAHDYYKEKQLKKEPSEFIQAKNETLEVNNVFKSWFNDNCEVGDEYKVGKDELIKATKISFKELKDELKRMDFKYNKDKMINKKKGLFEGFRIKKEECLIEENDDM